MAEADLSPTFTSRSEGDSDYDISTEDSSENENENTYTEASSDNSSSDPETESNAKSEVRRTPGVRQCQRQSQSRSELDQVVIPWNWSNYWKQFTRNSTLVVFSCFRKSKEATAIEYRAERRIVTVTTNRIWKLSIMKSFCDSFYLIDIHLLFST